MKNNLPLVSVIVITYNSSKFITETLDSIYKQSYPNIELIITDDCSSDDTIRICERWINAHRNRFYQIYLITNNINTGIPANCNRGYTKANGKWIKGIAGDDCLYPDAIEKYIQYANNCDAEIYFSSMDIFQNKFVETNKIESHISPSPIFKLNNSTPNEQYNLLTIGNAIFAPSVFMKKELFNKIGKYDEEITLCEDWPMWLKITQKGYKFHYIDDVLVKYRKYDESTWGKQSTVKKYVITNKEELINAKYIYPYVDCIKRIVLKSDLYVRKRLNLLNETSSSSIILIIYKFIKLMCDKYINLMYRYYHFKHKTKYNLSQN